MKATGAHTTTTAAAAEDGEKDKKKKRRQNRKPKPKPNQATPPAGGGCSSLAGACKQLSEKATNVAFNSLPPIHIGEAETSEALVVGETSRSFPLPTSTSSHLEEQTSKGNGLILNPAKRKYFAPHWSEEAVKEAIEKGNAFEAIFRVNAHNRLEAYCTVDGVPVDVLINGVIAQNRAIEGDTVAIVLDTMSCWTKLKGSIISNSSVLADDTNIVPQVEEVGKKCPQKEQIDANSFLTANGGYDKKSSNSVYPQFYIENEYGHTGNKLDELHQHTASENSGSASEQGEASRALGRILAMMNSCPLKRPTGRVIAIIKKSPRRKAIIGFLAKKFFVEGEGHLKQYTEHSMKKAQHKILVSGEDYLHLLPKDPKFPKMLVDIRNLPESAKERVTNGDETIERELVAAQIDEWSDESHIPLAHVIHILGRGGEIEPQIAAILFENAICAAKFSPESLACLPDLPWEVPVKEFATRKDFRNICTFTIDPSTAVDLDDALSIEEIVSDEVFRIGVHIADVSYFVLPETALDIEAQIKSTSVYILQHKIPMLPPQLSEELGSLLPGKDRLALSVTWDISHSGNIVARWIGRSIIRSCCKLSYDLVQEIIGGSMDANQLNSSSSAVPQLNCLFKWEDISRSLRSLYEISLSLRRNRFKDGALWLESSKLAFLFDEFGTPYDSFLHERKDSHSLVEEFMLLANMSVAEVISAAFPDCALLRRHPEPNLWKLRDFEAFCSRYGFELDTSSSGQLDLSLSKIREKLKDDPMLYDIIVSYASKSMQPASYFSTGDLKGRENEWAHYALSVPLYTHFTSPLRRYPDIIVHRTLCATLDAEGAYLNQMQINNSEAYGSQFVNGCFTGLLNEKGVESEEGTDALAASASIFRVPANKVLTDAITYCNERKVASKHAEVAGEKLYLWALLKKKQILFSQAKVLGLGPRFMSVYVHKLAMERRIQYDDVEGLSVEWLEKTSTLLLDLNIRKRPKTFAPWKLRAIDDVALVMNPSEQNNAADGQALDEEGNCPAVFPLVLRHLSTIPVALHAVGGDDGPLDIGGRLYMCSYLI